YFLKKSVLVTGSTSKTVSIKTRIPVRYYCKICNGKSVDLCIREKYMKEKVHRIQGIINSTNFVESSNAPIEEEMIYDDSIEVDENYDDNSNKDINFLPKKPRKFKGKMKLSGYDGDTSNITYLIVIIEQYFSENDYEDDKDIDQDIITDKENNEELDNNDELEQFINFDASEYNKSIENISISNINTTIELLILFMRYLLVLIDENKYMTFPTSLKM
ncbi:18618_t:CDS:2, partial [Racocetra persica]